jgi:carotenoid cleavage dioxygenase
MPRSGTDADVRWFDTELCYCFHPMNAYDDGDTVVVDVPRMGSVYTSNRVGPRDEETLRLERWTIDLSAGKVRQELVDDAPQEFCRVNESILGSPHRYGYTVAFGTDMPYEATRAYKHDFRTGTRVEHDFGAGRHPGELIFVGDPDRADDEDGGWLLGIVHDDARGESDLVVLDAADLAGPAVATVRIPRRVPYGFHGNWISD